MATTLTDLRTYFSQATLPQTFRMSECEMITDLPKMVAAHMKYLECNPKNKTFLPYFDRLVDLKNKLSTTPV